MRAQTQDNSPKRIALLHVAKKQLGLDDDSYRDILRRFGGAETSTRLDEIGFQRVMARMSQLGFRSTWRARTFGDRIGMATPAQISKARKLWEQYDPDDREEKHLNAWLHKYHHVSALRFVDAEKIKAVLLALKKMVARNKAKADV